MDVHFPNPSTADWATPPYTYPKQDPNTWPTADQLTDAQLLHWLEKMEKADEGIRSGQDINATRRLSGEKLKEAREKIRKHLNKAIAELQSVAFARGLRDPYKGTGRPE